MRFDWLICVVMAGLVITGSVSAASSQTVDPAQLPVVEQPAPVAPTTPVAAAKDIAPADIAVSPAISAAEEKLTAAEANIARLSKRVEESADNDDTLVELKLEIETLSRSMLDIGVSLRPRLTEIKARTEQLGTAPGEGEPAELDAIVEERNRLAAERSQINTLTGRAENVAVKAANLGDRITETRRELFSTTLLKRTELGPTMLSDALIAVDGEVNNFFRIYGSWLKFVWAFKWHALLGWLFFSLLAGLVFVSGAYRLFGGLIARDPDLEDPPYTSRLSVAFWSTIIPTVAMTVLVGTVYVLAESFAILRADVAPVIGSVLVIIVAVFFVGKLARGILAPRMPSWRLVDFSDGGARVLYQLVLALVIVNGLDYVAGQLSQSLGSPVVLTVSKSVISVCLMAFILIGMALVKPMLSKSGDPSDPGQAWPRVVSVTLLIGGVGLLATIALGYVGLARFAATQIVGTGAILTTMYIGYLSGKAISEPAVGLEQAGLVAGLLISVLVLLLGVPMILLQWGFQVQDIELWFYRILTEIRIGGITISLVGIFFGVVLFIIGLLVTRWFQGWLDGNVMSRGRMDTGVRNSIKTGIGYIGVAIAGLIGVSAAGIDLSSLALVAGALSLGIGFGLQNIVSNFVSGLILLAERPFKVGDWVVTGTTEGFVKKISVRATEIETFSRQSIIVPNSELINAPVGNWTHRNSLGRIDVPIGVSYSADPRKVIEILNEVANSCEMVMSNPAPVVYFAGFGDSSLDFEVKAHLADVLGGLSARTELRLRIFERLKAEGIEIPFPQRDLNIKMNDEDTPVAVLKEQLVGAKGTTASKTAVSDTSSPKPATGKKVRQKPQSRARQDSMEDGSGPDGGDR